MTENAGSKLVPQAKPDSSEQDFARPESLLYAVGRAGCRIFTTLYFGLKVYGIHHIPKTGGVLVVSNHQSALDPVLVGVRCHRPFSYMARATLFGKNKFFTWLIRSLNAFPVHLGKGDTGAMKEAIARLKAGEILTMFPEGTRTLDGNLKPIQAGVALIVRRAGVPVVPAIVDGAYQAWPKGAKWPRNVPIHVLYGPPLQVQGLKTEEIVELIDRTFHRMLAELRAKAQSQFK
ncbi:MAG TPA: lysophospholipid acyltransferase family protein [Tepidisphaeraceae bacterium]